MGKFSTPRVPIQTPFFDEAGNLTRTWIIFFERLGRIEEIEEAAAVTGHLIGWDIQDATAALDVSDPVIPVTAGSIARCFIRVKVHDATNDLEIDVRNNGASIFDTTPVIAAGTSTRDVHEFPTAAGVAIAEHDDVVLDIVQGGDWQFAVYLPYEPEETGE